MEKIIEAGNIVESKLSGTDSNDSDDDGGGGDDYGAGVSAGITEEEAAGIEGR